MDDTEKTKHFFKHIKIFNRLINIHPRIHKDVIFNLTIFLDEPIFKELSIFNIRGLQIKDIDIHSNCIKIYIIDRDSFHQLNIPIKKKNLTIKYQSFNSHILYNYIVSKIYLCGDFWDCRYYRMYFRIKDRNNFTVFETSLRSSIPPHILKSMINNLQYEDIMKEEI